MSQDEHGPFRQGGPEHIASLIREREAHEKKSALPTSEPDLPELRRERALELAVYFHRGQVLTPTSLLETAQMFADFLTGKE